MQFYIKIDGVQIKSPSKFSIESYNITKGGRVASGKMVLDLVAKKRKFLLRYNSVSKKELNLLLQLLDGNNLFFNFEYVENDEVKSAICYVGHIPRDKFRSGDGGWHWTDVNFDIIEQ